MCRLFAQHASPDHDTHEPLCIAHNALRTQSHKHPHGWGIGWYEAGDVCVRRGIMPAHADDAFVAAAREARSEIVLAHVRDASVGGVAEENTHPFVYGPWLFAHNGTVARFRRVAQVRARLEREIHPAFQRSISGDTDSERCFFLFLTRLIARLPAGRHPGLEDVRFALADAVEIVARIADPRSKVPSSLNLLVTNGQVLAVCRRGRPLHVAPHIVTSGVFALASEPIGPGPWVEVPEDGFVGIDPDHRVVQAPLRQRKRNRRRASGAPRPG
jgi:predicted glutamine amidotransferase